MSEEEEQENGNHIPVGTMQILNSWKCLAGFLQPILFLQVFKSI